MKNHKKSRAPATAKARPDTAALLRNDVRDHTRSDSNEQEVVVVGALPAIAAWRFAQVALAVVVHHDDAPVVTMTALPMAARTRMPVVGVVVAMVVVAAVTMVVAVIVTVVIATVVPVIVTVVVVI